MTIQATIEREKPQNNAVSFDSNVAPGSSPRSGLVNTAKVSSIRVNTGLKHKKQVSQFRLLGYAKNILIEHNVKAPRSKKNHRTATCHSYRTSKDENIAIALSQNPDDSRASIVNVETCGCGWGCPVCYERKALANGIEIQKAIAWAESENLIPVMVALTARHDNGMSLADLEVPFKKAWSKFTSNRRWHEFKENFGLEHYINNVDVTYGDRNGWHYHKHVLMFLNPAKFDRENSHDDMNETLTDWWLHCLSSVGLSATREHGLHISSHQNASSDYLAKIGLTTDDSGNLSYEMTSSSTKNSRTIWDILMLAHMGSKKNEMLYIEFVKHMTGKVWIKWSDGLHGLVDNFEMPEKEPETEQDNKMVKWLSISDYWWDIVRWAYAYGELLDVAAKTRDIESIRELLHQLRTDLKDSGKLSDYYRDFIPIKNSIADIRIHEDWYHDTG